MRSRVFLRIDVELWVPFERSTPSLDSLHEVVDYDFVRAEVALRLRQGHVELQETLCDDLATLRQEQQVGVNPFQLGFVMDLRQHGHAEQNQDDDHQSALIALGTQGGVNDQLEKKRNA